MLPNEATVFQAELMAIELAMFDLAGQLEDSDRYVKIFSDSRAAVHALKSQFVNDTISAPNLAGGKVDRLEVA